MGAVAVHNVQYCVPAILRSAECTYAVASVRRTWPQSQSRARQLEEGEVRRGERSRVGGVEEVVISMEGKGGIGGVYDMHMTQHGGLNNVSPGSVQ